MRLICNAGIRRRHDEQGDMLRTWLNGSQATPTLQVSLEIMICGCLVVVGVHLLPEIVFAFAFFCCFYFVALLTHFRYFVKHKYKCVCEFLGIGGLNLNMCRCAPIHENKRSSLFKFHFFFTPFFAFFLPFNNVSSVKCYGVWLHFLLRKRFSH